MSADPWPSIAGLTTSVAVSLLLLNFIKNASSNNTYPLSGSGQVENVDTDTAAFESDNKFYFIEKDEILKEFFDSETGEKKVKTDEAAMKVPEEVYNVAVNQKVAEAAANTR